MNQPPRHILYGEPAPALAPRPHGAVQCSPLVLDSIAMRDITPASLETAIIEAPANTIERRYVLARALNALAVGGSLVALAPRDKGGSRIAAELMAFGCTVNDEARRHHRIVSTTRPATLIGIEAAIAAGSHQVHPAHGLCTHPGVFSWDRVDAGSSLLLQHLPILTGTGADVGAGIGVLSRHVLWACPSVTSLTLIELDRRAMEAAKRNISDARAQFLRADMREDAGLPAGLDFIIMNPPFHESGIEDKALGQCFIQRAASMLRSGGVCWLVANRHLPYETLLARCFSTSHMVADMDGFKIIHSVK